MGREHLRKDLFLFLFLVFLCLLLFGFEKKGWLMGVRGVVSRPIATLQRPLYHFGQSFSLFFNRLGYSSNQDQKLFELEGRLRQLALDQNQLSVCLEENQELKKLLGAPLPPQWDFLLAHVVGQGEKMKLDLGQKDEVEEGMMVVSENILVGRVILVNESESLVQLISDPNSKIPVVVKRPNSQGAQAQGLLLGQFGGKIVLDRVLQEEDIQKGDLVVTGGQEGFLPDLLIGQIDQVLPPAPAIYQKAQVTPLVDYSLLRLVFLVKP